MLTVLTPAFCRHLLPPAHSLVPADGDRKHAVTDAKSLPFLPPSYFINLDQAVERRQALERELGAWAEKTVRVQAVDKNATFGCLNEGACSPARDSRGRAVKVLGFDKEADEEYERKGGLMWRVRRHGIVKPEELALTLSHIRAIRAAYDAREETALIFEDDVSLQDVPRWTESLQELVARAPHDWGCAEAPRRLASTRPFPSDPPHTRWLRRSVQSRAVALRPQPRWLHATSRPPPARAAQDPSAVDQ